MESPVEKSVTGPSSWTQYRQDAGTRRWEITDGIPVAAKSPGIPHQRAVRNLVRIIGDAFSDCSGELFLGPCDVVFSEYDVFQPDLFVVCDPTKIREEHIEGAPDLVIEVLPPDLATADRFKKLQIYAKYGVRECWIVTPEPFLIEVFALDEHGYRIHGTFSDAGILASHSFPDLKIGRDKNDAGKIREVLSRIPGSLSETIIEERADRGI
jgi:Uma2 family endonuclease